MPNQYRIALALMSISTAKSTSDPLQPKPFPHVSALESLRYLGQGRHIHDGASAKLAKAYQSDSGRHEPLLRAATQDYLAFDRFANRLVAEQRPLRK